VSKSFLFGLSVLLLLASCVNKNKPLPEGIIPAPEMVSILTDFHLAEATCNQFNARNQQTRVFSDELKLKILSRHRQSLKDFTVSLSYYNNNGEQFLEIYRQVIDSLQMRQANEAAKP
jgi:hypothetical protein